MTADTGGNQYAVPATVRFSQLEPPATREAFMRIAVRRHLLLLIALLVGCSHASMIPKTPPPPREPVPPYDIAYRIGFNDPESHLFDVQIDIAKLTGEILALQLPVWSPGRYAPFFFARNVSDFRVTTGGMPLAWDRENGSEWRVHLEGARSVTIHYRVFANTLSGTFSILDAEHANWNGPSMFMYVVGHKSDPVRLHIRTPANWHIVNGETRAGDQTDFVFDNYDMLVDTPTEVAPRLLIDSMRIEGRVYRVMIHHTGPATPSQRERFMGDLERIIRYENTVFDPPPLKVYTFMFHLGFPGGDGMEHLYSTQIVNAQQLSDTARLLPGLSTAAHEYFHVWNIKRVRPVALGPFDYTREQYQPSLWVAEGWTQYYGQMALHRSAVLPPENIYATAAGIIRQNLTAPGRKEVSARMSSFEAPFWDGATPGYAVDRDAWFSYYTKGAGIALYLDLFIRARTANRFSLDDAFRLLRDRTWNAPNASYYLQGRGYTEADVERAVSDAVGVDMREWFERHVGGTQDMDYDAVLASAGLRLIREPEWRIEPIPTATPAQTLVRRGWETGRTNGR